MPENNNFISLTKKILSMNRVKKGRTVLYNIEEVIESYNFGHDIIHHPESVGDSEDFNALLTIREIKARNEHVILCSLHVINIEYFLFGSTTST